MEIIISSTLINRVQSLQSRGAGKGGRGEMGILFLFKQSRSGDVYFYLFLLNIYYIFNPL